MGFLDQSTNNIIIDAVLTDTGRKLLANNQGNFKVAFFSLGDDEVDYSIIKKFGRAVGKEKINKNTPVFEAQTLGSIALKHRLLTLPNPKVIRLPTYSLIGVDSGLIEFDPDNQTKTVIIQQQIVGVMPIGVGDSTFIVQVPELFLSLAGDPIGTEPQTRIASYAIPRTRGLANGGAEVQFDITQKNLAGDIYTIYGDAHNKNAISGVISVIGDQSGIRKDFKFKIQRV